MMEEAYEYAFETTRERPDPEPPRCCACGHEITTVPVIRLFSDRDPDAQWSACNGCIATGRVYTWRWSGQT